MATAVRYTVLGTIRVWRGERELTPGPPKQQALLALLAVRAPEPVTLHEAVDLLWDGDPPDSAVNVVHRHIGGLRRLLEPDLPPRAEGGHLVRTGGGYRLAAGAAALDLARFRELRAAGQRAIAAGAAPDGVRLLVEALRLWQGPVAVPGMPHLLDHPVFVAVENEYVATAKETADATPWQLPGLAEDVLTALRRAATGRHRLDEALQARIVTALAASGRQAEALEVFGSVRADLSEELGMDPSPELRAAHEQVLRQSGPPDRPAAPAPGQPPPPDPQTAERAVRPAQLPADLASFVGRHQELARSRALLQPDDEGSHRPVVIGAISGMAGVGKTTLAVHWAHTVAEHFPDGQLYVNLRGFHPAMPPLSSVQAMRDVIDALGVKPGLTPDRPDALASLYRSLFAGRRFLILLDNARDSEQVRPLLPAAGGCLAIITSRHRLDGLIVADNARFIPLDLLSRAEGVELLVRRLGEDRVSAEPAAAEAIVDLCGRLPLALAIASARAVLHPTFSLAAIAAELRENQGGLDAFATRDTRTDARSIFSWSYHALSPAAARLFRLLSLHAAPDIAAPAAASLAGVPLREVRRQLAELVEHHLLTEHTPGRFAGHELLRAYAAELCEGQDDEQTRAATRRRMVEHYLRSAHTGDALLAPHRERVTLPAVPPGVCPQTFGGQPEAADWFQRERQVLLAMVEQAARHAAQDDASCWQLAATLELFLDRHGRWQEQHHIQTTALDTTRRTGDLPGQANALRALGFAACRLGAHEDAQRYLTAALELFERLGDPIGKGRTHRYNAFLANVMKDHHRALDHYRQAADCYAPIGFTSGQAAVLNEIGWTHLLMGAYESTLVECEKAVTMHQEIGDLSGEAAAWDSLACAQHHLERYQEALVGYGHAVDLYRRIGDRSLEADTLVHAGDSHRARADSRQAERAWRQALELYDRLDHPDAAGVRERLESLAKDTPAR
ncbi:DNA-binding transcriptional activator of the SARP family [Streptomyces sp. DvalAA-14]|uniref:AfsR/SARP family transcriptional regulator n=1 Tax=unclassified Streptomyces TaxID=2593676 RepID=UPI00081B2E52|nr:MULTISPECIES: BTAD domain-containing putative transcriptional regulator [unclassified Streptomyces]MYS18983.1 AfsR family transcriptional regulator [Streptomyces sp. SID4948]SCD33276.1 DNA-binding transcriptional activator of the SARP family [Streptomyces sp. DvalAA-14]